MLSRHLAGLSDLGNKKNIVSIFLISNALVWYFAVLSAMPSDGISLWAPVHFSALIVSAFAGASYAKQLERSKFLMLWMITGVVSSTMLFGLGSTSAVIVSLTAFFLGLSLGFGMPACMSYFTDNVQIESRGRVGGIAMLVSGIGIVGFGPVIEASNLFSVGLILAVWRLLSLLVFLGAKDYRRVERKETVPSYKQVLSRRSFVLYFVPWIMFSLVDYGAAPQTLDASFVVIQTIFMGGAAFLGGFFMDSIGRKPMAIAGFAMLGLGTAILGLFGELQPFVLYFNAMIDGVAYGFLFVLFVMTLWGDLSHSFSSDKYYALGVMPFFVSTFLGLTLGSPITEVDSYWFSFAAFFLFLAVLPLFYALETLPEKVMKERQLNIYIEKAQEIAQKYY